MKKDEFKRIEKKWQKEWEKNKIFSVREENGEKYYVLEMYPYPSASGLHMGHAFNYVIGDIIARYKMMQGYNVLHPMGYDSFGLPAENAAIKVKVHPKKFTEDAIKNFIKQQKALGLSYDWDRILWSHDPSYYKWNQYFFIKLYEKGLVYRKKAPVNYCEKCKSVLANEQVHNGKCWRHKDTEVKIKLLEQWFIKISDYAEELLSGLEKIDWPENIKIMQKNWIGKSEGAEIYFEIEKPNKTKELWPVFTTRPDTIYGVSFLVISVNHPRLMELVAEEKKKEVENFVKKNSFIKKEDIDKAEKEGVFTGSYAINPINGERVPVWVGNFVLADYGSGMVMAVPAHDQRDFEFAKKYNLPIKIVIQPEGKKLDEKKIERAYEGEGILINSEKFNGMKSEEAKKDIVKFLEEKGKGKKSVQYKLKDWLISRQRYWGTPIPFIYCEKCGVIPVPLENLPVILPKNVKFGKGNPLLTNKKFVNVKCPICKGKAKRETDTMDTFFDSSWYFLRFCDPKNKERAFDKEKIEYWMPVDQYIGGAEHACMHLIYARFFVKALRDLGLIDIDEPFIKLFNQGMVCGEDGTVMAKSKGNVVNPLDVIERYSSDVLRMYLVSVASPDKDFSWSESGIEGIYKFLKKIYEFFLNAKFKKSTHRLESKLNKAIKEISIDIENFQYNLAIIKLRKLFDVFCEEEFCKEDAEKFIKLLTPFCPHIAEELWHKFGNKTFISKEKWPICEENKIDENIEKEDEIVEKLYEDINNILKILGEKEINKKKIFIYVLPNELKLYENILKLLKKRVNKEIFIFSVADKNKYDPQNKSSKAKPGKPAIYIE